MKRFLLTTTFFLLAISSFTQAQIRVNEVMASNSSTIADEQGEFDDWVEIYNASEVSINIGGMYVTDNPSSIKKWQIPNNQSAKTTLAPGSFTLLWFDKDPEQGPLHIDTKLSSGGEHVILTDSDGTTLIDSVSFGPQTTDISWGRVTDGNGQFQFLSPTPGASNVGSEVMEKADAPSFSLTSGYYSGSQAVGISTSSANAEIRYTTGGSVPTASSTLYTGPISIDSSTVVRAVAIESGKAPSPVITNTYLFSDTHTIPTVSFVMEPDSLFDYDKGMYVLGDPSEADAEYPYRGANFWQDWEYPVHIEYLSTSGNTEFEFLGGASIGGNFSRGFAKKSFIINNNSRYGIKELNYELFPENDYDTYDGFGLRAGAEERSRLLNELMYTINQEWNHHTDMQAYEPVALYINGQYWGIYNLQERKNDDFVEARYGYKDIDMIKDYDEVKDGDDLAYRELLGHFRDETLTSNSFFNLADSLINLESFTDHWVYQVYTSHGDPNNIRYWKARESGTKWHFISHDFDWWADLGEQPANYKNKFTYFLSKEPGGFWLLGRMMQNETYQSMFLNRLGDMLNTAFEPNYLLGVIDSIDTAINPEMPRDIARWDDGWADISGPTSYDMEYIRSSTEDYIFDYPQHLYAEIKDTLQTDTARVQLAQTQNGRIQLNSITPNTEQASWSGVYFKEHAVTVTAKPSHGYMLSGWTVNGNPAGDDPTLSVSLESGPAVIEASFMPAADKTIVINEINYNPKDDFDAGDWVELHNYSTQPVNVSDWVFKDDDDTHAFTLPEGTVIPGLGYLVMTNNLSAFKTLHPEVSIVEVEVSFGLSGKSDDVRIFNSSGVLIDAVTYHDDAPWPTAADGDGYTLELSNPELDNSQPENWNASAEIGGSPGAQNGTYVTDAESEAENLPQEISLSQNYPNPFNPTTQIAFSVKEASFVNLSIHNILGQEVQQLVSKRMVSGNHQVTFDAQNLPSGVYIYRLTVGQRSITKKMILLK